MLVAGFGAHDDRFVAINERGRIMDLNQPAADYLRPADHGTWMAYQPNRYPALPGDPSR